MGVYRSHPLAWFRSTPALEEAKEKRGSRCGKREREKKGGDKEEDRGLKHFNISCYNNVTRDKRHIWHKLTIDIVKKKLC